MTLVKLKEKGQVTIPAAVREQISAHKGDVFEIGMANGNIILKPRDIVSRKRATATKTKKAWIFRLGLALEKGYSNPLKKPQSLSRQNVPHGTERQTQRQTCLF